MGLMFHHSLGQLKRMCGVYIGIQCLGEEQRGKRHIILNALSVPTFMGKKSGEPRKLSGY